MVSVSNIDSILKLSRTLSVQLHLQIVKLRGVLCMPPTCAWKDVTRWIETVSGEKMQRHPSKFALLAFAPDIVPPRQDFAYYCLTLA
eukprot:1531870-Amphidinium_carterae.1